ncbi:hypothetical protein EVAR_9546_1 [Eumeta japonica]|uniref:Uncharacterized protein n=1 Tax=Eumeta variegata TaxID=151549 RepID=A0A4C1U3K7_EUMVA|nr:hypothetical protein EVAR_9546_1 [Eumeta japonica]
MKSRSVTLISRTKALRRARKTTRVLKHRFAHEEALSSPPAHLRDKNIAVASNRSDIEDSRLQSDRTLIAIVAAAPYPGRALRRVT